jgi:hypothetical protein
MFEALKVVSPACVDERLCQLGPVVISIDYVLAHMGFMWSRKLSSFDDHQVG